MPVTPQDMLASAKSISEIAENEADLRSSISRYYYSGYHAAKIFHDQLSKRGLSKANVGDHENLIHMLNNPTLPEADSNHEISKELSQYLKKCLFNRRLADYQIEQPVNTKNLEITKAEVKIIFDAIYTPVVKSHLKIIR